MLAKLQLVMSIIDFQNKQVSRLKLPEITDVNLITQSIDPVTAEGTCVYSPQDNKMYYSNGSAWITDLGMPSPLTVVAPIEATDTNVLNITGSTIRAQFATSGLPGVLNGGAQNISGVKNWLDDVIAPRYRCNDDNIRIGNGCLANPLATLSCAIGNNSQASSTGQQNSSVGVGSLQFLTTGIYNNCVGVEAGQLITSGSRNCLFGRRVNPNNTIGVCAFGDACCVLNTSNYICAFGHSALTANSSGVANTSIGAFSMLRNTTGNNNTTLGYNSLAQNITSSDLCAFGTEALENCTGANNIAIGSRSGKFLTTGTGNLFIGTDCAPLLLTGVDNTILNCPMASFTGSNSIFIGAGNSNSNISNQIRIGNNLHIETFIQGIRNITTNTAAIPVVISTTGQLGTTSSRRELKENITLIDEEYNHNIVMGLKPQRFSMKNDETHMLTYGLIVDEVFDTEPDLVALDANGNQETVYYNSIPILLLAEVQRMNKIILDMTGIIEDMNERLVLLENK